MTRINTNVSALTAQQNLSRSNKQLQTTLTRLSTGLRINSAADDPAGMIAATDLGSDIGSTKQAISNSQVASQMISTADSALSQVSSLLTTINGLITSAANTASMSSSQIAANQLQIDSSLDAINRISQTTTFQGQKLLNGSLGFLTSGVTANYATTVKDLQVNQVNMGSNAFIPVDISVTTAATQAKITDSMTSGNTATATFTLGTGSIVIDAPTGGTQYNGTSLQIKQSASVTSGTAVASYDAANNVLTVTVGNVGTTNNSVIAAAIAADTPFKVDATTAPTGVYNNAGAQSTLSLLTSTTTGGGVIQINAKDPNSTWDGTNIQFSATGSSSTPHITWTGNPGSGTLTIQVASTGTTTLQAIADAINNSTDTNVQKFAASVTTAGNFNPLFDGNAAVVGANAGDTYNLGAAHITVTANNHGLASNGMTVHVTVSGGATTAQYSSATNTLTVNLAAGSTITAATLNTALTSGLTGALAGDVVAFQNAFTVSGAGGDIITGANAIAPTAGATANGTETITGSDGAAIETLHNDITDGVNTLRVTMTATGQHTADAGAHLVIQQAAPGTATTSASYDNSGAGTLTITVGNGQSLTTANINAAIGAMGNAATFNGRYGLTYAWTAGGSPLQTAYTNLADQTTTGGTNDITAMGGNLAGGGISATFAGGTGSAALSGNLVVQIGSDVGTQQFSFISGTTALQMITAINQVSDAIGVTASLNTSNQLQLNSTGYGTASYVKVNVVSDGGTFASNLSATHAVGTDIQATVNNIAATGSGNTVSLNTPNLSFSATLADGAPALTDVQFRINGGGALFQLGAVVNSGQQARLGIQNVDSSSLGGTAGRLYEIGSGQDASLTTDTTKAARIVQAALDAVTSLRGRLGAFQTETVDTNISTLSDAVTNLTGAQSNIQDADFAGESASVTREQILVQSGTTVLGIANANPASVLSLLQKAAQV